MYKKTFQLLTTHILGPFCGFLGVIVLGFFVIYPIVGELITWTDQLKTWYLAIVCCTAILVGLICTFVLAKKIKSEKPGTRNRSLVMLVCMGWGLLLFIMLQELFQWWPVNP